MTTNKWHQSATLAWYDCLARVEMMTLIVSIRLIILPDDKHHHKKSIVWYYANWIQVRLTSLELDGLLPCTKGCPDRWSRHAPPKLKS